MSGQLILGKDVANDNYVPISVDSSGHLDIDVQVADLVMRANDGNDGAGTDRTVKCDSNGELLTQTTLAAGHGLATEAKQDTINSTIGDTNSKIDAMRGTSDLGAINTSVGTVNSTLGDTNSKIDAMRGSSDLGAINTNLTNIEAHQGNIENNLSSIQSTVSSNKLQVDVITNADSTKATSTNQSTMIGHLSEIEGAVETIEGCVSGSELQVDIVSSALPSGAATAVNQTTANTSLSNIDGKVATQTTLASVDGKITACNTGAVVISSSALPTGAASETTLAASEVHLGNIDTQTSSIQSNVSTSANQSTMITHLSEIEGAVETVEACVASNRLAVDTNNANHGTLTQLSVSSGLSGQNSAILNTAGYSNVVLVCKNSSNTSIAITASALFSDSASFTGGTDFVYNGDDSSSAFAPVVFQSAASVDSTFTSSQAVFNLTPPAQYMRINLFQGTGSSINVDFFYVLSR